MGAIDDIVAHLMSGGQGAPTAPALGSIAAMPAQAVQANPILAYYDKQANDRGETLSAPSYTPTERLGNAAQDAMIGMGAQPPVARHLADGLGSIIGMTPLGAAGSAADLVDAKNRGDAGGVVQGMAGMIPGVGPEARYAKALADGQITKAEYQGFMDALGGSAFPVDRMRAAFDDSAARNGGIVGAHIADLVDASGRPKQEVHDWLLDQAKQGNLTIHPSTAHGVPQPLLDAGIKIPGFNSTFVTAIPKPGLFGK